MVYAEQFLDLDASIAQPPEELLRRARMILSTELGKDPLLRHAVRDLFKREAVLSVLPTDRGISKIDEHHPYFVSSFLLGLFLTSHNFEQNFKYLYEKRVTDMLESPQFLNILEAEAMHLVSLSIILPSEAKAQFERSLNDAFASDSYSDAAKAWNEERSRVVQEAMQHHLIPVGAKWTREWVREEVEDFLATRCGDILKEVSVVVLILTIDGADFDLAH